VSCLGMLPKTLTFV